MPNLTEFADQTFKQHGDNRVGIDLAQAGPIAARIARLIGPEGAPSLLATKFWQAFFRSPAVYATLPLDRLRGMQVHYGGLARAERIVVARPTSRRFDVLVFLPGVTEASVFEVRVRPADLAADVSNLVFGRPSGPGAEEDAFGRVIAAEVAASGQPFGIILMAPPRAELCKGVPSPCGVVMAGNETGSVGLVVRRMSNADQGVTTAAHVTAGATATAGAAKTAQVGSAVGTVEVEDLVADAGFIKLTPSDLPTRSAKGAKGVMKNILPRALEPVEFEVMRQKHGADVSTVLKANVTGWSMELPTVDLRNQLKVYTTLQTEMGDSGAAIVNDDDFVLGFAHERCDDILTYSSWIWAEQVMLALDVEAL